MREWPKQMDIGFRTLSKSVMTPPLDKAYLIIFFKAMRLNTFNIN